MLVSEYKDTEKPSWYYSCSREEMLGRVPTGCIRILDIGCAAGRFGEQLKNSRKDAEVWGVEICVEAAAESAALLDRVIVADFEKDDIELPADYFDCVIFNDVLEHMIDPWKALVKVRQNLKAGGYVIASIPNMRYFYPLKDLVVNGNWKYEKSGMLDRTHLRFFTRKSIEDMFVNTGFEIVSIEGINPISFSWKFKLFNWIFGRRFEDTRFLQFACVVLKKEI